MPLLRWGVLQARNFHPFIVYADLPERGGVRGAGGRQDKFALLGTLLKALKLEGDYARLPEAELIRVAFTREDAARAFADTLGARRNAREGGWAGQWAFLFDDGMMEKIRAALPPAVPRTPRGADRKRASL